MNEVDAVGAGIMRVAVLGTPVFEMQSVSEHEVAVVMTSEPAQFVAKLTICDFQVLATVLSGLLLSILHF